MVENFAPESDEKVSASLAHTEMKSWRDPTTDDGASGVLSTWRG